MKKLSLSNKKKSSLSEYHLSHVTKETATYQQAAGRRRVAIACAGLLAIGVFWVLDACIGYSYFYTDSFINVLFFQVPPLAFYTRMIVSTLIVLVTLLCVKIADANRLELALKDSSKWFSTTLKSIGAGIVALDKDGAIIFMNTLAQKLTGWPLDRAVGRDVGEICGIIAPTTKEDYLKSVGRVIQDGYEVILKKGAMLHSPNAPVLPVMGTMSPIIGNDGKRIGAVVVIHDLTESTRAEETIHRLATAVEQAGEAILIADRSGCVSYVNPSFERVTGFRQTEVMGRHVDMFKNDQHDREFYDRLVHTLAGGSVWRERLTLFRKDGARRVLSATVSRIVDSADNTTSYVSISEDITHELELQKQLNHSQKMEAIGRLAGGIAHDFNNILTAIMGFNALLMARLKPRQPHHRYTVEINKASSSAQALVRQLLAFARKGLDEVVVVNPNEIISDMEQLLHRLIKKDVQLVLKLDPAIRCIRCERDKFNQVVMNLVVNASDAMPDGGAITVTTTNVSGADGTNGNVVFAHALRERVRLSVADSGLGMDETVVSHIFEPFFTTKEPGKGTGLGLAIVYGFIKQVGGDINVTSKPNQGTTFDLFLPAVDDVPDAARLAPLPEGDRGKETILVVDHDPLIIDVMSALLSERGYTILSALNSADALRLSQEPDCKIDLVLTEIAMPKMNGFGLAEKIREHQPATRTLYMSGCIDYSKMEGVVPAVENLLINKPFTADQILARIRLELDRRTG